MIGVPPTNFGTLQAEQDWRDREEAAEQKWMGPRAAEAGDYQYDNGDKTKSQLTLTGQAKAKQWPAPNVGDGTRGRQVEDGKRDLLLDTEVRDWACSHQGQETTTLGQMSLAGIRVSPQRSQLRRLNPYFVEWLMGWPPGWTGCGVVGMGLFRWWRRRHLFALRHVLMGEVERLRHDRTGR